MEENNSLYENEYVKVYKKPTPEGYPYTVVKARTGLGASIIPMIPGQGNTPSRFLILSQHRPPMGGISWEFPAGGVDEGENPKETAIRELEEEANIIVEAENVHLLGVYWNAPTILEDKISLYIAVLPENYDTSQVVAQEGEILSTAWLTLDELVNKALTDMSHGLTLIGKLALAKSKGFIKEPLHF